MHEAIHPFPIHLPAVMSNKCNSNSVVFPEIAESHLAFFLYTTSVNQSKGNL